MVGPGITERTVIRTDSPTPIRSQLRSILLKEIDEGRWPAHRRIPSERALAEQYGISRASVRESIAELISEGILFRTVGKGTFVAARAAAPARTAAAARDVAFLISEDIFHFVEPGYHQILAGVEQELRQSKYRLVFHSVLDAEAEPALETEVPLAGCIVTGGVRRRTLEWLERREIPTVLVDLLVNDERSSSIAFDYAAGARMAVEHLASLGHREIGFVGFPNSEKYRAYWETLESHGIAYNPRFVQFLQLPDLQPSILAGFRSMQKMMAAGSLPTAVLATNDLVAVGVMEALGIAELRVPDQISIIGFDDLVHDSRPPLTTVRVPMQQAGRLAARALLDKVEGNACGEVRIRVPVELIVRGTTAAPPSEHDSVPA